MKDMYFQDVIQIVNCTWSQELNHHEFQGFVEEMEASHTDFTTQMLTDLAERKFSSYTYALIYTMKEEWLGFKYRKWHL